MKKGLDFDQNPVHGFRPITENFDLYKKRMCHQKEDLKRNIINGSVIIIL